MSRLRGRRLLIGLLLLVPLFVGVLYLATPRLSRTASFREAFENTASRAIGRTVRIGSVEVGYDLTIAARDISVSSGGQEPFLVAQGLRAAFRPAAIFAGTPFSAEIESPSLYVDRLQGSESGEKTAEGSPEAEARGRSWFPPIRVHLRDAIVHHGTSTVGPIALRLDASGSGPLTLAGETVLGAAGNELTWTLSAGGSPTVIRGEMHGSLADLAAAARSIVDVAVPEGTVAKAAAVHAAGEALLQPDGGVSVKTTLTIEGLDGHDAEHVRVLQGAGVKAALEVSISAKREIGAHLEASVASGEVLWDLFYGNLTKHPLRLGLDLRRSGERIRADNVVLEVKDLATLSGKGTTRLDGKSPRFDLRLTVPDLAPAFDLAIREPLKQSYPFLVGTTVAGRVAGRVSYEDGRAPKISGRIEIHGGDVTAEDASFRLTGLDLDVPFRIGETPSGAGDRGSIAAAELVVGGVRVDPVALELAAEPGRLRLARPVAMSVLGGTFNLERLSVEDLGGPERSLRIGFSLGALQLGDLTEAMGWPTFGGSLSGAIPEVTVTADHVRSEGQIEVQVFGGTVRIRNLRIDQLLSPVPEFALDLDVQNLSLRRVTDTFAVGHISGVVNGSVAGLVIVKGQPVRFDGWLKTAPTPRVDQKISVTALRQISILGGAAGDSLTRGFLGLFDEYGYAKMGFHCRLRNDRFVLAGVERQEGKEVLVVGSFLPPKVNVVSHNQVIAFSEMVRRLRRAIDVGRAPAPGPE